MCCGGFASWFARRCVNARLMMEHASSSAPPTGTEAREAMRGCRKEKREMHRACNHEHEISPLCGKAFPLTTADEEEQEEVASRRQPLHHES